MKVVYIAGPFRGKNYWAQENNIRRAEALAHEVWLLGAAALCPHTNTRFFQGSAPDEIWLQGDLELLRRCDAIMLTADWRNSSGAKAERDEALLMGIPAFETLDGLKAWLDIFKEGAN